ncbi:MAG: bifunctional DNA-formamidopyrimidine glycosylase/DNA-(apurinic or apyrimidinic site) lyase, partial [Zoogloeaceae bacterium]|nr:bifunctional DNA-formamidopyrimidine glycosylase/DNA-(apurinic or apyrimidinic site) lyase [Zoogloeaceae bacterium]
HRLAEIRRRGKYLLFHWPTAGGWLILHLGMSGSLRLVPGDGGNDENDGLGAPPGKHDHFDLVFPQTILRFKDPRRFGRIDWQPGEDPLVHPLLASLGMEPLSPGFTPAWLAGALAGRRSPIKPLLMDARFLVGVGNIYASESLFRAGISPLRAAGKIGKQRLEKLAAAIQETLREAIAAGGSSLRDYVHSDGGAGSFQLHAAVYGRAGQPCPRCGTALRRILQSGRASFYCPRCQR